MQNNIKDRVVFASPKDYEERSLVAGACVRKLGIKFPAVVDGFENSTEKAYTGWPDRIYLIDSKGARRLQEQAGPVWLQAGRVAIRSGTPCRNQGRQPSSV